MKGSNDLETSVSFEGNVVNAVNNPFTRSIAQGFGVNVVGHLCMVFGGYSLGGSSHDVFKYNRVTKKWTSALPECRHSFGSVRLSFCVNDKLYAYIWYGLAYRHVFLVLDLISMEEWLPAGRGNPPQTGFGTSGCYVEARNEAILFGGSKTKRYIFVYSVGRSSWYSPKVSGNPPSARDNLATCSLGLKVFVSGGERYGSPKHRSLDLHVLSMHGKRFSWCTPLIEGYVPSSRYSHSAVCVSGRMFVYGGVGGQSNFDIYSIKQNRWYEGVLTTANEKEGTVQFKSKLARGNSGHTAVVIHDKMLLFGGLGLSAHRIHEITAV